MRFGYGTAIVGACIAMALSSVSYAAAATSVVKFGLPAAGDADYAPIAAAERLGYFKAAHLKVETTVYKGGAIAQQALSAGAADVIGYFGPGAVLAITKGAKSRIVGALATQPYGWYILTRANSDIKSLKDLNGKTVGISSAGSLTDIFMLWAADHAGVKVTMAPLGMGALVPGGKAGQIAAFPIFPDLSYREVANGQMRMLVDLGKDMPPTYTDVLVASKVMTTSRAAQLRAFLGATYRALAYMQHHKDFALSVLKSYSGEKDKKILLKTYEDITRQQPTSGRVEAKWLARALKLAAKAWHMPALEKVDLKTVYSNKFLPAGKMKMAK